MVLNLLWIVFKKFLKKEEIKFAYNLIYKLAVLLCFSYQERKLCEHNNIW